MTNETKIQFLRVYSILLGIVIVIAGICLMAGCLSIYNSGDQPYSREVVAQTFSGIAFPVYLCLAMTLLGFVLEVIVPSAPVKAKAEKPYAHLLSRLHTSRDLNSCSEDIRSEIASLQKKRNLRVILRTVVILATCVVIFAYGLNGSNFHESDINGSMIRAMYILIPFLLISFGFALFTNICNERSIQKEIELMKQAPAIDKASAKAEENTAVSDDKKLLITRCTILAVGIFFLVFGFVTGGTADVLAKAINICTECIGLG